MRLQFNGTAAAEGFPAVFCECKYCQKARELGGKNVRTRSSCLINEEHLIDFPPDTYMHTLYSGLRLSKVKHIIITHSHQDHFAPDDLCMVCPPFAYPKENEVVYVYGNEKVYEKFKLAECEIGRYKEYLQFVPVYLGITFKAGDAEITPLLADHGDGSEICHIYVIKLSNKYLLYGHDTGYFPEETWEALKDFKLDGVILDCTCGKLECERGHMGISTNVKVKERLMKQGSADNKTTFIVTHYSHNCDPLYEDMVKLAEGNGFTATFDGMKIEI
jgi:phosphoribosyl 1,2-cyclic phosphate phosphodiesterase